MTRAIFINSVEKTITEIDIDHKDLGNIYNKLGKDVRCFDVVSINEDNILYIDDEGLCKQPYIDSEGIKHNMVGFIAPFYRNTLMGNGLVFGMNYEGDTLPCEMDVEEVAELVTFVEYDNPEERPQPNIQIVSFD